MFTFTSAIKFPLAPRFRLRRRATSVPSLVLTSFTETSVKYTPERYRSQESFINDLPVYVPLDSSFSGDKYAYQMADPGNIDHALDEGVSTPWLIPRKTDDHDLMKAKLWAQGKQTPLKVGIHDREYIKPVVDSQCSQTYWELFRVNESLNAYLWDINTDGNGQPVMILIEESLFLIRRDNHVIINPQNIKRVDRDTQAQPKSSEGREEPQANKPLVQGAIGLLVEDREPPNTEEDDVFKSPKEKSQHLDKSQSESAESHEDDDTFQTRQRRYSKKAADDNLNITKNKELSKKIVQANKKYRKLEEDYSTLNDENLKLTDKN